MWQIVRHIVRDWITPTGAAALIGLALLAWLVSAQTGRIRDDVRSIEVRLANIETDVTQMRSDVASMRSDVASMRTNIARMQNNAAAIRDDIAQIREDLAQIREYVSEMQDDAAEMQNDAAEMRDDLAEIRAILLSQQQPTRSVADDADSLSTAQAAPYGRTASGFPLSRE